MSRRVLAFSLVALALGLAPSGVHAAVAETGPFAAGSQTVTVRRADGSTFSALLYYPAQSAGAGAPVASSPTPFSAIAFGHGFLQQPARYSATLADLATRGHVVIATTSETGLFPSHSRFAADLSATLDYLANRNLQPGDPLFGRIDVERSGVFGHSMGGGASLLTASADPRVKAAVGLAAALTNPSPLPLMPALRVPVALVSGDQDAIVPAETATIPLYEAAQAPKVQSLIVGGSHVGFQDDPFPLFSDEGPLPVEEQTAMTRAYLASFFGLYLQGDQSQWRHVWGPEAQERAGFTNRLASGIRLTASEEPALAAPGATAVLSVTLANEGPEPNRFDLLVEGAAWNFELAAAESPLLAPGEQFTFQAWSTIPSDAPVGAIDRAIVSARSQRDGATRGYIELIAQATIPEPTSSALALLILGCPSRRRRP